MKLVIQLEKHVTSAENKLEKLHLQMQQENQ